MYKHASPINRPPPLPTIIIHLAMYQTQNKTPNAMVNPAQNKKQTIFDQLPHDDKPRRPVFNPHQISDMYSVKSYQ